MCDPPASATPLPIGGDDEVRREETTGKYSRSEGAIHTAREDRGSPRAAGRWLVGAALLVGLLAGAVVGAGLVTMWGGGGSRTVAEPTVASDPPVPDGSSPSLGAEATITEACLRALEAAERAYAAIDDAGSALLELDARRLDELIHDLQPLQAQLQEDTTACRIDLRRLERTTGSSGPAPVPTTSPR
jgi:hypothetical protein